MLPMNQITFEWRWSSEAKRQHFVATGESLPDRQMTTVPVDELTPEQRETLLKWRLASGAPYSNITPGAVRPRLFGGVNWTNGKPGIEVHPANYYDEEPSVASLLETLAQMVADAPDALTESQESYDRWQDGLERQREARERLAAEQEAREKAEREAMLTPTFEDDVALIDLYQTVVAAAGVKMDTRLSGNYVKRITGIDLMDKFSKRFLGGYVREGTVKIGRDPALYLVCAVSGSRKHTRTEYHVVRYENGIFEHTGIHASGDDPGWYLILENPVQNLLDALNQPAADEEPETDLAQALGEALALEMRGEDIPVELKETLIALLCAVD